MMKPRVLIDIIGGENRRIIRESEFKINLSFRRTIVLPLKFFLKTFFVLSVVFYFIFSSASAPTKSGVQAAQIEGEKAALESQLAELEKEIVQHEATIQEYKKQGKSLSSEIKSLEAKIAKLNLQIKSINLNLAKLDEEINSTQKQIVKIEGDIDVNKKVLSDILKAVYENDNSGLIEVLLKNPQLSDFFGDLNNLLSVQDNLRVVLGEVIRSRQNLVEQKEILAVERSDAAALKTYQDSQRENILKIKNEKNNLLKVTKGKESEYQKILTERKKSAAEIRKQIFRLLGGGELTFEKAYELAKFAEKATGIRAAFVLAILDRESAIGQNVGRCDYKTAMHPSRDIPVFLEVVKELGLDKDLESEIIKVSCANADGAYGGAMGPAQFIPSTWALYKERVSGITGSAPASPWRNVDAFVATALYLKDAYDSKACVNYSLEDASQSLILRERCAAAQYYAGNRWYRFRWAYGEPVVEKSNKFQQDIDILNGQLGVNVGD